MQQCPFVFSFNYCAVLLTSIPRGYRYITTRAESTQLWHTNTNIGNNSQKKQSRAAFFTQLHKALRGSKILSALQKIVMQYFCGHCFYCHTPFCEYQLLRLFKMHNNNRTHIQENDLIMKYNIKNVTNCSTHFLAADFNAQASYYTHYTYNHIFSLFQPYIMKSKRKHHLIMHSSSHSCYPSPLV